MHILRSSPYDDHMTLTSISNVLRDRLIHIANVSINDLQWSQATLPVKGCELGFRSPVKLCNRNSWPQYQVLYSCRMICFVTSSNA